MSSYDVPKGKQEKSGRPLLKRQPKAYFGRSVPPTGDDRSMPTAVRRDLMSSQPNSTATSMVEKRGPGLMDLAQPRILEDKSVRLDKVAKRLDKCLAGQEKDPGILSLGGFVLRSADDPPTWGDLGGDHSLGKADEYFDLVGDAGVEKSLARGIIATMGGAGQLDYLASSGILAGPDGEWEVVVEVHYYRKRSPSTSKFHKDTLGQTLFVNLNYVSKTAVAGPEYVVNPAPSEEHDDVIGGRLPPAFLADLSETRKRLPEPRLIHAPRIEANGAVAFVDEIVHHMTPTIGGRRIATDVLQRLVADPSSLGVDAKGSSHASWSKSLQSRLETVSPNPNRWLQRGDLTVLGLPEDVIDRAIAATPSNQGYEEASLPVPGELAKPTIAPVSRKGAPRLTREMSQRELRREKLPGEKTKGENRTFFRTWVRARRITRTSDD